MTSGRMTSAVARAVEQFGPPASDRDTREVSFHCPSPRCSGKAAKLSVNASTGWFLCYRCGLRGNVLVGREDVVVDADAGVARVAPPSLCDVGATPVRRGSRVWDYLESRGFDSVLIDAFDVCESRFRGRLDVDVVCDGVVVDRRSVYVDLQDAAVFPLRDGGYRGYQARYVTPRVTGRGDEVRWWSSPGLERSKIVFNADVALSRRMTFIAEGITSAASLGPSAAATFGKSVSRRQVARMIESTVEVFYVAFDGDARAEALALAVRLAESGKEVRVVRMERDEDPSSLSRDELRSRIMEAEPLDLDAACEAQMDAETAAWDAPRSRVRGKRWSSRSESIEDFDVEDVAWSVSRHH